MKALEILTPPLVVWVYARTEAVITDSWRGAQGQPEKGKNERRDMKHMGHELRFLTIP